MYNALAAKGEFPEEREIIVSDTIERFRRITMDFMVRRALMTLEHVISQDGGYRGQTARIHVGEW